MNVTISGTNFTGAIGVSFGSGISVDSFTVDSATQITASVKIGSATAAGLRNVSITTPSGTGTLLDGFTVTEVSPTNQTPGQPSNVSPANGATDVSLTTTLQSSAFSDPDTGDTHAASQWQISTVSSDYSSPVFDSGTDNANLSSISVPSGVLSNDAIYCWHVRYQDYVGAWSAWSPETSFSTAPANQPPSPPSNASPSDGATVTTTTPTLRASAFSDPDSGDTQSASQWQVTSVSGDYASPVYDSGTSGSLTQITIPFGILKNDTSYYWRVRHQDSSGNWSQWSAETSFSTLKDGFAGSVPFPSQVSTDPEVIGISALLALILVIVFYFAATLFNSTIKENEAVIQGWLARVANRLKFVGRFVDKIASSVSKIMPTRSMRYLSAITTVVICASLYWFLDPYFNSRLTGGSLFLAMFLGIGIVTCAYEGSQFLLTRDGFGVPAMIRIYWIAIPIAAVCVVFSRAVDFHPGIIYGFVGGYVALPATKTLEKRQQALVILFGAAVLLAVALTAFLLRDVVQNAGGERGGFWLTLADETLVAVFVVGVEGLAFALIPLTFMDGAKIKAWKFTVWFLAFLVVGFVFYHIIINKEGTLAQAVHDRNAIMMFGLMAFFLAVSFVTWRYFARRRKRMPEPA